jgi:hypothetical protein
MNKFIKEINLIHGIRDIDNNNNNKLINKIQIRCLDGFDEELLNEMEKQDFSNPFKTSVLLSRIISVGFGDKQKKQDENQKLSMVRNMIIGDRICVLLNLRQLVFGDIFQFEVKCDSCQEFMSIDMSISEILNYSLSKQNTEYNFDEIMGFYKMKFSDSIANMRLLNGFDEENMAKPDINEIKILESCILNIDTIGHEKLSDEEFVSRINLTLSELDPLADILLSLTCPTCHASFKIPFIAEDFFFKEIHSKINNSLEFEVHLLALNYHWSESEILSLPIPKRKRYVQLVNNTLEERINNEY